MPTDLETVADAIRTFRQSGQGKRRQIPTAVQRQAVQLLEQHSWKEVCEVLAISNGLLGRWRLLHQAAVGLKARRKPKRPARPQHDAAAQFVELPAGVPAQGGQDFIELCMTDGTVLRASGAQATNTFVAMARALLKLERASS